MSSRFLLDTNHLSAAITPVFPLRERLHEAYRQGSRLGVCVLVLCELEPGIQNSVHQEAYRRQLLHLLRIVRIWPLEEEIALLYGEIYLDLRRRGRALSSVDIMLAAFCRHRGLTLLTADRDFEALPDLHTENWLIVPPPGERQTALPDQFTSTESAFMQ